MLIYTWTFAVLAVLEFVMRCQAEDNSTTAMPANMSVETTTEKKVKFESFIVGGTMAHIRNFPHSAYLAIQCMKFDLEEFACGSSILNQMILLTAAHCFEDCRGGTKVTGSVGYTNKLKRTVFQVAKFVNHPLYDGFLMANDIALAKIQFPLRLGRLVQRVALPRVGIYDEPAVLAGWGVTDEDYNTDTTMLKSVRQVVWTRSKCMKIFPRLSRGFFCAMGDTRDDNFGYAAVGDSGSALLVRNFIQIGLVSHKISQISKSLIVYADTAYYYRWIEATSRILYCNKRRGIKINY